MTKGATKGCALGDGTARNLCPPLLLIGVMGDEDGSHGDANFRCVAFVPCFFHSFRHSIPSFSMALTILIAVLPGIGNFPCLRLHPGPPKQDAGPRQPSKQVWSSTGNQLSFSSFICLACLLPGYVLALLNARYCLRLTSQTPRIQEPEHRIQEPVEKSRCRKKSVRSTRVRDVVFGCIDLKSKLAANGK